MENGNGSSVLLVREDLVKTAVQFLQNPRVRDSSTSNKEAFLRKKGLNEEELKLAFQRAGPSSTEQQKYEMSSQLYAPPGPQVMIVQQSYWSRWQNVAKTVVLVSGMSYGIYYLFDRFLGAYLWGSRDRLRSMEQSLVSLDQSLTTTCRELQESIQQITETLAKQQLELSRLTESRTELLACSNHISKLETEIGTVKGLLLSRRQFPTVPSTSPGIPSWQLSQDGEGTKDSSAESGDPSPVSNGTSSPELVERVDDRGGSYD